MSRRLSRSSFRPRWLAVGLVLGLLSLAVVACGPIKQSTPNPSALASAGASANAAASAGSAAVGVASPTAVASASAAAPSQSPAGSPKATATPEPQPLRPVSPGADPWSLLNWAFTPIFQVLFLILAGLYALTGNILVAIVVLTVIVRLVTVKLSARQIVSQQRMMRLQPELRALNKELQRRLKGDRQAIYQATQEFYKERGVSPTSGCLPSLLQMGMLVPMYAVIRIGLTNYDPSAMLGIFGVKLIPLTCPNPAHIVNNVIDKSQPCINTVVGGIDMGKEQVLFNLQLFFGFSLGVSVLALIAAFLQLIQSRQMMPPAAENDPSASTSRTMMIMLPLFSILYGGILPAGLFIYWIVSSIFSIVQQFLIIGWGNIFPIFGWSPAFAQGYEPRFPVTMPDPVAVEKSSTASRLHPVERSARASTTVRPNTRRQSSRRGRRR